MKEFCMKYRLGDRLKPWQKSSAGSQGAWTEVWGRGEEATGDERP